MEKNQKETGITLSFFRSDAIHCTRKRIEKNACPRKPIVSQKCSDVIIVPSPRWPGATGPDQPPTLSEVSEGRKEFRRARPARWDPRGTLRAGGRGGGGNGGE